MTPRLRVSCLAPLAAACTSGNVVDLGGDAGLQAPPTAAADANGGRPIATIGIPVPAVYDCGVAQSLVDADGAPVDDAGSGAATISLPGTGSPATAADGWILFASDRDCGVPHIFAVRSDGGRQIQITSGPASDTEPAVSPDGGTVAFTSTRAGTPQIFAIDLATNAIRQLTSLGGGAGQATFSPDGKRIAFRSNLDLYTMTAGGGDAHPIFQSLAMATLPTALPMVPVGAYVEHPVFEPGGDKIIVDATNELDEIDLTTLTERRVVRGLMSDTIEPALSRSGADVAFVTDSCGATPVDSSVIEIANAGGALDVVCDGRQGSATNLGTLAHPSWGPGSLITFAHFSSALLYRIVVADTAHIDRPPVELVQDGATQQDPTWAPSTFNPP